MLIYMRSLYQNSVPSIGAVERSLGCVESTSLLVLRTPALVSRPSLGFCHVIVFFNVIDGDGQSLFGWTKEPKILPSIDIQLTKP